MLYTCRSLQKRVVAWAKSISTVLNAFPFFEGLGRGGAVGKGGQTIMVGLNAVEKSYCNGYMYSWQGYMTIELHFFYCATLYCFRPALIGSF